MPFLTHKTSSKSAFATSVVLLGITVSVFLFGAAHPPTLYLVSPVIGLAVTTYFLVARPRAQDYLSVAFVSMFALSMLYLLFAIAPFPESVYGLLSGDSYAYRKWLLEPVGQLPLSFRLSTVPSETALHGLRLSTGAMLFMFSAVAYRHGRSQKIIVWWLTLLPVAMILVASVHRVFGILEIYGLVLPTSSTPLFGPLVNPNHQSKLYGVIGLWLLAIFFDERRPIPRPVIGVGLLSSTLGVLSTLSRWGILIYVIFLVILCATLFISHKSKEPEHIPPFFYWAAILLSFSLLVMLMVSGDAIFTELLSLQHEGFSHSKIALYAPGLELIKENPVFGIAPGAFPFYFPAVAQDLESGHLTYSHIENWVLQLGIDYGLLFAFFVLAIIFWTVKHLRRRTYTLTLGLYFTAAAYPYFCDIFDFSNEIPAIFFVNTMGLGMLVCTVFPNRRVRAKGKQRKVKTKENNAPTLHLKYIAVVTQAFMAIFMWQAYGKTTWEQDRTLGEHATESKEQINFALISNPNDAHRHYQLAGYFREQGQYSLALQSANRAAVLWPNYAPAHVEAARSLYQLGFKEQAKSEYKEALRTPTIKRQRILEEVYSLYPNFRDRVEAIPQEMFALKTSVCDVFARTRLPDTAIQCYDFLRENELTATEEQYISWRVAAWELLIARRQLEQLRQRIQEEPLPMHRDFVKTYASAYALLNGCDEALMRMAPNDNLYARNTEYQYWKLRCHRTVKQYEKAIAVLDQLRRLSFSRNDRLRLDKERAQTFEAMGDDLSAYRIWKKLGQEYPQDFDTWRARVRVAVRLGQTQDFSRIAQHIQRVFGNRPGVTSLLESLKTE